MRLDLSDEETFALLNLLIEVIEADRYPMSPRIRLLRLLAGLKHGGAASLVSKRRGRPSNNRLPEAL
jgi:hypothetical protein